MGEWHAIEAVDEGIEHTKGLLFEGFNSAFWLRLTLLVLLTTLGTGLGTNFNYSSDGGEAKKIVESMTPELILVIIIAFAILFLIGLVMQYIASAYVFVFIGAVREKRFSFIGGFGENAGRGLSLFLFQLALGVFVFAVVLAMVAGALGLYYFTGSDMAVLAYAIAAIVALILVIVVIALISSFTVDFVAPVMQRKDVGVVNGWRSLAELIWANAGQFVVYVLMKIVLGFITGVVTVIVAFMVLFAVGLSALAVGVGTGVGLLLLAELYPALSPLLIAGLVLGVIAIIVVSWIIEFITLLITLPFHVFYRCYSMLFLQRIKPELNFFTAGGRKKPPEDRAEYKTANKGGEIKIY